MNLRIFAERRDVEEVTLDGGGPALHRGRWDAGLSITREHDGERTLQWFEAREATSGPAPLPAALGSSVREILEPTHAGPPLEDCVAPLLERLRRAALGSGASRVQLLVQRTNQRVLAGGVDAPVEDLRRNVILETRVCLDRDGRLWDQWRSEAFDSESRLLDAAERLQAMVGELTGSLLSQTPAVPCPVGELPIIMPPGAGAACFFHEVCGHPLEGDVVLRQASYLARLTGKQIAPEFLNIVDDPTGGPSALTYRVDDEGVPAAPAHLLREGRVSDAILDRRTAARLGRVPNGHGRRVGFRHHAVPRMSHTAVLPSASGTLDEAVAGVKHGVLIRLMTPRHMNLLSGDFSFYLNEAHEIRDGRVGAMVGPGVLRGNGLSALAAMDFVGADTRNLMSTRGCRKLSQPPLPVSFGQPTLRFRSLGLTAS